MTQTEWNRQARFAGLGGVLLLLGLHAVLLQYALEQQQTLWVCASNTICGANGAGGGGGIKHFCFFVYTSGNSRSSRLRITRRERPQ
jgi:hypothetical protein